MRHKSLRVAVALAAFLSGVGLARRHAAPPHAREHLAAPQAPPCAAAAQETPARPATPPPAAPSTYAEAPRRVGQEETVAFRGLGRVKITAYEPVEESKPLTIGGHPGLVFTDAATGRELADIWFSWEGHATNVQVRFKVLHLEGLPDPLVVGVALTPGGSDSSWEAIPVGPVNGELRNLAQEMLTTGNQGGFFFGDLGKGIGPGAAAWEFIWDFESETHYQEHQYEMKLYRWNPKNLRFEWYKVLRTDELVYPAREAPRSLGFSFDDVRKKFPDFADVEEY